MNDDVRQDGMSIPSFADPRSLTEQFERLRRRIHATRTIRFRSHIRLERRHRLSSYVIALLSIIVIAISVMPNIYLLNPRQDRVLLACTIIMSTFIICLVLTECYESFYHKASVLHQNARRLDELSFELSLEILPSWDRMRDITRSYNDILQACPLNHAHSDYLWVKARYPDHFGFIGSSDENGAGSQLPGHTSRAWDRLKAAISEFAWMIVPLFVCVATIYAMYSVVSLGWPDGMPPR
jgi:SMODS and SLOG-associating 2TM effector domain family 5